MAPALLILPEMVLLVASVIATLADALARGRVRTAAWVGAAGSLTAAGLAFASGRGTVEFGGAVLAIDGAAQFARVATCLLVAVFCVWAAGAPSATPHPGRAIALTLVSGLGSLVLAGARDWVTLLLAVEASTIPLLALLAFEGRGGRGGEAAVRYLVASGVATMATAYGVSFLLAASGSLSLEFSKATGPIGWLAAALMVGGLLAKLGSGPFDALARRAFAGAPAWAVAVCSAVPKVSVTLALARVVEVLAPQVPHAVLVLYALGAISMVLGTAGLFRESDMRGMMARSGALNAGFVLVALAVGGALGLRSAVFYALAYAVPSLGLMLVVDEEGPGLAELSGLSRRRRAAAWALVVFVLSLIGVAPTVGFLGKLYVLGGAVRAGALWVAVLGVGASVLSAGPYGRLVRSAFSGAETAQRPHEGRTAAASVALALAAGAAIALGVAIAPALASVGLPLP